MVAMHGTYKLYVWVKEHADNAFCSYVRLEHVKQDS